MFHSNDWKNGKSTADNIADRIQVNKQVNE